MIRGPSPWSQVSIPIDHAGDLKKKWARLLRNQERVGRPGPLAGPSFNLWGIHGIFLRLRITDEGQGDATRNSIDAVELVLDFDPYPDLATALAYWRSQRRGRSAPARDNIDPVDIVAVLPRVMLVEVSCDPLDFRYRLAGTGIRSIHGEALTSERAMDLMPPEYGRMVHAHYELAVERRTPLLHLLRLGSISTTPSALMFA